MRSKPLLAENAEDALEILVRGFPEAGQAFWRRGLERIRRIRGEGARQEIGVLAEKNDAVVGVLLGLPSVRRLNGQVHEVINFSSWYVDPSLRAFAPMMLRSASKDPEVIYTDLTPRPYVAKMLPPLGFRPIGADAMQMPTLLLGRNAGRGELVTGGRFLDQLGAEERRIVEDHIALDCLACGLSLDGAVQPLIFLPRRRKKVVPGVEIVYAPSRRAVFDHLPLVARFLAGRGKLFLEMDLLPGERPDVPHVRKVRGERFVKGPYQDDAIDFAYSELVYLGV